MLKTFNKKVTGTAKRDEVLANLGCSIEQLKGYIAGNMQNGMTWQNMGRGEYEWKLRHVESLNDKRLTPDTKLQRLHFKNLKPGWNAKLCCYNCKAPLPRSLYEGQMKRGAWKR
jgi:hypothetical protein